MHKSKTQYITTYLNDADRYYCSVSISFYILDPDILYNIKTIILHVLHSIFYDFTNAPTAHPGLVDKGRADENVNVPSSEIVFVVEGGKKKVGTCGIHYDFLINFTSAAELFKPYCQQTVSKRINGDLTTSRYTVGT